MGECIRLQESAFRSLSTGDAYSSDNAWLRMEEFGGWIKLLAGCITSQEVAGVKALARNPGLPSGGNLVGLVLLYDARKNQLLAIMDAVHITAVRTGAGGGLAARYLARRDARVVGVLGSGVQARMNLEALVLEYPELTDARVYSRTEANRNAFIGEMEARTGLTIAGCDDPEAAVKGADIVVTATNSSTPVLQRSWLRPGTCILMMGIKTEVAPECFAGGKIVVDDIDIAVADGKIAGAVKTGRLAHEDIHADLASVVRAAKPGRVADDEITFFDSSGVAAQDIVCASYCYHRAKEVGLGLDVVLEGSVGHGHQGAAEPDLRSAPSSRSGPSGRGRGGGYET